MWLEERIDGDSLNSSAEKRAVKTIYKSTCSLREIDYRRELLTMAKFSRVGFFRVTMLSPLTRSIE